MRFLPDLEVDEDISTITPIQSYQGSTPSTMTKLMI